MRPERADPRSVSEKMLWGRKHAIIYVILQSIIYTNRHGHQDECIQLSAADIGMIPIILYSYFTGNFELHINESFLYINCIIINSMKDK